MCTYSKTDAPVAGRVLAHRALQLLGHQRRVPRRGQDVAQHRTQQVRRLGVEHEARSDPTRDGELLVDLSSADRTLDNDLRERNPHEL